MNLIELPERYDRIQGGTIYELAKIYNRKQARALISKAEQTSKHSDRQYLKNEFMNPLELDRMEFTQQVTRSFEDILDCLDYLQLANYRRYQNEYHASIVTCGFDMSSRRIIELLRQDRLAGRLLNVKSNQFTIYCNIIHDLNKIATEELLARQAEQDLGRNLNNDDHPDITPRNVCSFNLEVLAGFLRTNCEAA